MSNKPTHTRRDPAAGRRDCPWNHQRSRAGSAGRRSIASRSTRWGRPRRLRTRRRGVRQPLRQRTPRFGDPAAATARRGTRGRTAGHRSGPATGIAADESGAQFKVDDAPLWPSIKPASNPEEEPLEEIGAGGGRAGRRLRRGGRRRWQTCLRGRRGRRHRQAVRPPIRPRWRTISGPPGIGFRSLVDAAITVDDSKTEGAGHLLVIDDLKPGSELPKVATYEFSAGGGYLDTLTPRLVGPKGAKGLGPVFGEPSGIAVDPRNGDLYVTTGNSEEANVVKYGPFEATAPPGPSLPSPSEADGPPTPARLAAHARTGASARGTVPASASVVIQRGPVRVSFNGKLTPHALPRHGTAPVGIAVDAHIAGTGTGAPPQLRRIAIEINRNGRLSAQRPPYLRRKPDPAGDDRRSAGAPAAKPWSAKGIFAANVKLPEQSPFPSRARSSPSTAASTASRRSSPISTAPSRRPRPTFCPSRSGARAAPTARSWKLRCHRRPATGAM